MNGPFVITVSMRTTPRPGQVLWHSECCMAHLSKAQSRVVRLWCTPAHVPLPPSLHQSPFHTVSLVLLPRVESTSTPLASAI